MTDHLVDIKDFVDRLEPLHAVKLNVVNFKDCGSLLWRSALLLTSCHGVTVPSLEDVYHDTRIPNVTLL